MENFIRRPSVDLYKGVRVTKDTMLDFSNENVEEKIEALVMTTILRSRGEGYESESNIKLYLSEGDVLVFEGDGRGYIKPVERMVSVEEAIEELTDVKEVSDCVCSE
jgi:hypothetical protein